MTLGGKPMDNTYRPVEEPFSPDLTNPISLMMLYKARMSMKYRMKHLPKTRTPTTLKMRTI